MAERRRSERVTRTQQDFEDLQEELRRRSGDYTLPRVDQDTFFRDSELTSYLRKIGLEANTVFPQILSAVRAKNLLERFPDLLDSLATTSESISALLNDYIPIANQRGLNLRDLVRTPDSFDSRLYNPDDIICDLLEEVLSDPKLSKELMKNVDAYVSQASSSRLEEIYEAEHEGAVLKTDITIIGDGPVAICSAFLLSSIAKVTLIWNGDRLCGVWRNRPLFINSSVDDEADDKPRLPLIGNTTPLFPNGVNSVKLSRVLTPGDLTIECVLPPGEDASNDFNRGTRRYIRGSSLGNVDAVEGVLHAEYFLANQEADLSNVIEEEDGTSTITFTDTVTGKVGRLNQKKLIVCTGPGKEVCKIPDPVTQAQVNELPKAITTIINNVRRAKQKNKRYRFVLPRLLNLTAVERLYGCWVNDLDSDPKYYPFSALQNGAKIGIIGGGDTAFVLSQFVDGTAPTSAYANSELTREQKPNEIVLFNVDAATPQEFAQSERPRYAQPVFNEKNSERVRTVSGKVQKARYSKRGFRNVVVVETVNRQQDVFDIVFDATGISPQRPEDTYLPSAQRFRDAQGFAVGKTNDAESIFALGTAAQFANRDLPSPIRAAIEQLGIKENPVALWATIPTVVRALLTIQTEFDVNTKYIDGLLSFIGTPQEQVLSGNLSQIKTIQDVIRASVDPSTVIPNKRGVRTRNPFQDTVFRSKEAIPKRDRFSSFTPPILGENIPKTDNKRELFTSKDFDETNKFPSRSDIEDIEDTNVTPGELARLLRKLRVDFGDEDKRD